MTTTNPNSLYNIIKAAVVDGKLPRDFSLPKPTNQELPFADGAMDGIFMFHMEHTPMTEDDRTQMVKAVDCMNRADYKASDEELMEVCKKFESYFLEQVMKEMMKTVNTDESSSGSMNTLTSYFKDELISKVAEQSTETNSNGLAQMLFEQMKRNYDL